MKKYKCTVCGNFGILAAMRRALVELGHALPAAQAAKICNSELTVIAMGGDGDGLGEGGNHFIAAMNRNVRLTYLMHDNQVYALTKGQASPTSDPGYVTLTTPQGSGPRLNPLALAVACDCSLVMRGFSGDVAHLTGMIKAAIQHNGFVFIDVLQPCVSFNHKNTFAWYKERVYKLDDDKGYNPEDPTAAFNQIKIRLAGMGRENEVLGVTVQPMVEGGVETIAGVAQDPSFGPLILFGLGGIYTELIKDVALKLQPLTDRDAHDLVHSIKMARLFEGYRGLPPSDTDSLEDLLLRLSAMVEDLPQISELDFNPVKVMPKGEGYWVVDARIMLR